MPSNQIGPTGITIQTLPDITTEILSGTADYPGMLAIYGSDINVLPSSPDGQMINIVAQAKLDMLQFIVQAFSSFDPDQAVGVVLDQRCAINGVVREAGTYSVTPVTVTATAAVSIAGLDTAPDAPFTVSDAAGTKWYLQAAHAFSGAGSASLSFQAALLGATTPVLNTITTIVTAILGISAVNNPASATTIGTNEESDAALRLRRQKSVSLPSRGYYEGLLGALVDTAGVTSVNLLENDTDSTDANGIPSHSIWAIVNGGLDADIANVIYVKRNAGCGMKGAVSVVVTRPNSQTITIRFDRQTNETLWVSFNLTAVTGTLDAAYVRAQILQRLSYQIGEGADASSITALVKLIAPNCYTDTMQVSPDNVAYSAFLDPTGVNYQFQIAAARVIINGVPG